MVSLNGCGRRPLDARNPWPWSLWELGSGHNPRSEPPINRSSTLPSRVWSRPLRTFETKRATTAMGRGRRQIWKWRVPHCGCRGKRTFNPTLLKTSHPSICLCLSSVERHVECPPDCTRWCAVLRSCWQCCGLCSLPSNCISSVCDSLLRHFPVVSNTAVSQCFVHSFPLHLPRHIPLPSASSCSLTHSHCGIPRSRCSSLHPHPSAFSLRSTPPCSWRYAQISLQITSRPFSQILTKTSHSHLFIRSLPSPFLLSLLSTSRHFLSRSSSIMMMGPPKSSPSAWYLQSFYSLFFFLVHFSHPFFIFDQDNLGQIIERRDLLRTVRLAFIVTARSLSQGHPSRL